MIRGAKAAILDPENNILILHRSRTHPHVPHTPDLPGGKVDDNETMTDGLLREIREETGIDVKNQQLALVSSHKEPDYFGNDYYIELYEIKVAKRPTVLLSAEHDAYEWRPKDNAMIHGELYSRLLKVYQRTGAPKRS